MGSMINNFTQKIAGTIDTMTKPAMVLPKFLLYADTLQRPGMSVMDITSRIIKDNEAAGIPSGKNADGSSNLINTLVYNIVKQIVHSIKFDGVVNSVIPKGSLQIVSTGGSPGGPVTTYGYNVTDTIIKGLSS